MLLAVVASMYAVYHGPEGLRGDRASGSTDTPAVWRRCLRAGGVEVVHDRLLRHASWRGCPGGAAEVVAGARERGPAPATRRRRPRRAQRGGDLRTGLVRARCCEAFGVDAEGHHGGRDAADACPQTWPRTTPYLTHEVFSTHRSETQMLRYLRTLSARDYALDRGMIPLGSCTMKLNATTEMEPVSMPGFADLHPFAPAADAEGYRELIEQLEAWLAEVDRLRPRLDPAERRLAGRAGRAAGDPRLPPRQRRRGARDVCLIPSSAHGTNAASAVMAGMQVVVVKAADDGSVDLDDLRALCEKHADTLAAIMVTYPSTHGAYEDTITELCRIVHEAGGQVYVDGANLNALLGYARPGRVRRRRLPPEPAQDLLHPARRRRPGRRSGRRARAPRAVPARPTGSTPSPSKREGIGAISAAPYGSAGILPISWAYIAMMGADGLTPRDGDGRAVGQLHRGPARRRVPGALQGPRRAGRPRVHPRPARPDQGDRASPSTTSRSGSSTTASTRRRCRSRSPAP